MRPSLPAPSLLIVVAVGACGGDGQILGPRDSFVSTPIRTDETSYELRQEGAGLAADIPLSFENQTPKAIYIVNCRGGLAPVLEKDVEGEWVEFWSPVLLLCLSPPIVIQPGGVLEDTLHVWGALPGGNHYPQFESDDVEGTYRIVLYNVVFDYDHDGHPFGDPVPLEYRVSNRFSLDDPRR